ncbi:MAG: endonuclease Q family protein [Nanoarchaeota archaeon]|nr:endonuclease Q family protein [Nanoarchaeota archaeon]MBU1444956.1 endonuclease Q family protein [Nanoarchaeota archaeon]MBU2420422.1 endonuclease Q family protein [Nanoarchaeota archaeon]MBU2475710.1 endonuclease Q family protein [Nanoarchaeota archaeon]
MIIADLHIHSKYSRATSKAIDIYNLEKWAKIKGVNLLGTGDFTHPKWIKHIKETLEQKDNGILVSKNGFNFILQTEISLMYSQGGKGRRVHLTILAPNLEVADQIIEALLKKGRLDYDGRPIFGFSGIELVEMMEDIGDKIEIIPAHIWTPWFGVLGSKSGFDSIEEAFQEKARKIHAVETGISSDPAMNWRLSGLDKFQLVSFSDMHSAWPWRIGREATLFDVELSYKNILSAIRTGGGLNSTVETDPGYGIYHFDGHRNCNVVFDPKESIKHKDICPVCNKPLTIGVQHRVEVLSDREEGFKPKNAKPFLTLIPLTELIAAYLGIKMLNSKGVWEVYNKLIKFFDNEFNILMNVAEIDLGKVVNEKLAKIIIDNRHGKISIKPGYDGLYGKVDLGAANPQKNLSGF